MRETRRDSKRSGPFGISVARVRRGARRTAMLLSIVAAAAFTEVARAASPPAIVNYQGVLRDAANAPQTGDFDMIFRFYSLSVGGDEILVDQHTAADGNAVNVALGLFTAFLGGGVLVDGSGPGVYSNLSETFRDYPNVFLSVEVGGEVLTPRIRILSAGYALNADYLDGKDSTQLLDTSAASQSKAGSLEIGGVSVSGGGIGFPGGGAMPADANGIAILAGADDLDSLTLQAGNDFSDGRISINGDGPFELRSGNGHFHFVNGVTGVEMATLNSAGNLIVGGVTFSAGTSIAADASGVSILAGADDTDHVTLQAGNDLSDGKLAINGDGPFELRSGNGFFHFINGVTGVEMATLTAAGSFVVGSVAFSGGASLVTDASGVTILAGADDTDQVTLQAGNDFSDGRIAINGDGPFELRSGNGFFHFFNGVTGVEMANLNTLGDLTLDGDLTVEGDDIRFTGGKVLSWSAGETRYELDDEVAVAGPLRVGSVAAGPVTYSAFGTGAVPANSGDTTTSGDVYVENDLEVGETLYLNGAMRMNDDGPNGDQFIYFYDGGSSIGESLSWDYDGTSDGRFELSNELAVNGPIRIGSTAAASLLYNHIGAGGGADSGVMTNSSDLYVAGSLEVDGGIYANAFLYMEDLNEGDQAVFFFNNATKLGESLFWDDSQDRFELSDHVATANALWVGSQVGTTVDYNRFGAGGTPGASMTSVGDVYIENDLDVDGVTTFTGEVKAAGGVGFVQNHPYRGDLSVVYAAPAGDEAATYTRGSARLVDGVARVPLDESFSWVTNPDIGLTAHLTARGRAASLYVESLTTKELVVRAADPGVNEASADAPFDYIIYGLRIGFEERSAVRSRTDPAPVPKAEVHEAEYGTRPELRDYTPLERFRKMGAERGVQSPDLGASRRLREAIGEYVPEPEAAFVSAETAGVREAGAVHAPVEPTSGPASVEVGAAGRAAQAAGKALDAAGMAQASQAPAQSTGTVRASGSDIAAYQRVSEPVGAGDVLVVDRSDPGSLRRGDMPGDPGVVGVVSGEAGVLLGPGPGRDHAPVALVGIAPCKADAAFGAIAVGDLLSVSPTPGHAMRAIDPLPGTVLGKALEPLAVGTGVIRMLIMPR
jgi:hypothetical protein